MPPIAPDHLTIDTLGSRGEGLAHSPSGTVSIPYALPGERVEVAADYAARRGRLLRILSPSPDRAEPICPVFGSCGGCATQHIAEQTYLEWKRGLVSSALIAAGITADVDPCIDAHGAGRRRITLHARRGTGRNLIVGFSEARSHALIPIQACPVTVPGLDAAFGVARAVADVLASSAKPLDLAATATLGGIDVDVRGHGPVGDRQRLTLIDLATRHDLARLSVHGDILVERRPPQVTMGRALVTPPAGGFLQATTAGEDSLFRLISEALGKARRVADLFAGCGTFTFRLAEQATVHAVETDRSAVDALERARRHTQGLKAITSEVRDLFRRPLHKAELSNYDAVVFDPPRAGAEAQARQLATSGVPLVIAVSCSPSSLGRDLRILIDGGYRLTRITPVDQFRYSAHVETVAVLTTGRK